MNISRILPIVNALRKYLKENEANFSVLFYVCSIFFA